MAKILLISSYCFEDSTPNGICANSLADAFFNNGDSPFLIGCSSIKNVNTERKYWCKSIFINKMNRVNNVLINFITTLFSPKLNKEMINDYLSACKDIIIHEKITRIICFSFPLETIEIGYRLKKMFPFIKVISYELDSAIGGISHSGLIEKISRVTTRNWIKKKYPYFLHMFYMESHKYTMEKSFNNFLYKTTYCDLPLLKNLNRTAVFNSANLNNPVLLYAGELNVFYRNPKKMFETLTLIDNSINFIFNIFAKGNCQDIIDFYSKNDYRFKQHKFVNYKKLKYWYQNSNFFVNIGNLNSMSVPSKLIEYISYGKPIIHFSSQKDDVCHRYLQKYPASLIIYKENSLEESKNKIINFLFEYKNFLADFNEIKKIYYKNTPEYSVEKINSLWIK